MATCLPTMRVAFAPSTESKIPQSAKLEFADDPKNFARPFYLPPLIQSHHFVGRVHTQGGREPQIGSNGRAGTDASRFNEAGNLTVCCRPGGIAQAHTSDEWINLHEVEVASVVFQELIKRVLMTRNCDWLRQYVLRSCGVKRAQFCAGPYKHSYCRSE